MDVLAEGTLPRAWARRFAEDPSNPALCDQVRGWITAGQLDAETARVAGRLHAAGLRPGDRIITSAESSSAFVIAYVGAVRLGLVVVPTNTAYREREISYLVRDAEPAAAIVDDDDRSAWIRAASTRPIVVTTPDVGLPDGPAPDLDVAQPHEPMMIPYTSGTTGEPKGAVLSHANALAGVQSVVFAWKWTASDRLLLSLPLFHMHGLGVGLHGTLLAGASAVLFPRFDAEAMLGTEATLVFGVPTMYARFAVSPDVAALSKLRLCVSGSASLPPTLFERIEALSGQRVLERYGMTETCMNVSNPYEAERRPGTVGFPLPGVELRLAGDGEIRLRGPNVFGGYWRKPDATAEAFDRDGWFKTGDIGDFDADGYLRIAGRSKELIITGGYNVHPREVEDVIREHPDVVDVAVKGTPDDEWGEVVTAYLVAPAGTDVALFAAERLAPYKRPRIVHFVDELPRNAMGKVMKHQL